jgi:hypothetical protein
VVIQTWIYLLHTTDSLLVFTTELSGPTKETFLKGPGGIPVDVRTVWVHSGGRPTA